ncbi:MAG: M48 family metallopeptidase [Patescibacteria group bacterium]
MYSQIESNKRRTWILIALVIGLIVALGYGTAIVSGYQPQFTMTIAFGISLVLTAISYFAGDTVALSSAGATQIEAKDNPYYYKMVENLTITAGMKTMPKLYVIDDPAINAFATGRDPEHASIAVTTGALTNLENEELEGVLAHELAHIQNYDIRIMTIVIVLVGSIALIADMFRYSHFARGGGDSDSKGNQIAMIIAVVLIILSPIFAQLIQLAISRRREYLADATGSMLTRYPEGLASALEKIRDFNQPMQHRNHATAHLYLESPFRTPESHSVASWFATHPPIDDRINILRTMGK